MAMQEKSEGRTPEHGVMGTPNWWHHHGTKMKVHTSDKNLVVLKGTAAEVQVEALRGRKYKIKWEVVQCYPTSEKTVGRIKVEEDLLEAMFGLSTHIMGYYAECSRWLRDRYGGGLAAQGRFIRWKEYLNIPGPGTGHDGDPNVSIDITDEIKEAIKKILDN